MTNKNNGAALERVRRIGLGTAQFGLPYGISNTTGQVPRETARALLELATSHGITHLDTAPGYGTSESVVGALVGPSPSFHVSTKTRAACADPDLIAEGIRQSTRVLNRHPVDAILVHDTAALLGPQGEAIWRVLQLARDLGACTAIGISAYVDQNPRALAERFQPDVMQLPLSLLDQRLVRDGTLDRLQAMGVAVHARSIFLQGLPFMKAEALPPRLRHASTRLDAIRSGVAAHGMTMIEALTAYALTLPQVTVALVGVTTPDELAAITAAAARSPPPIDWTPFAIDDPVVLTPTLWNQPS